MPWHERREIVLFLSGDLMLGRGIDQVLPHPGDPRLHEPWVDDARHYLRIAERCNGPIPRPADYRDPWGAALDELGRVGPDLRIVNLETAVTTADSPWPHKAVHYRMHPANLPVLTAAGIDCCVLANNHVMDHGPEGLRETLETLHHAGIATAGAGANRSAASVPAMLEAAGRGRVWVFGLGAVSSGIPADWAAGARRVGLHLLTDPPTGSIGAIASTLGAIRREGDIAVVSIHWGGNWGYAVPPEHRELAHRLIDEAGVDLIHGHSSHHPLAIEVYRNRLILYGCGDFINDYEGIAGYSEYRGELVLMYFPAIDPQTGNLLRLDLTPLRIRRFRLERVSGADFDWMRERLDREYGRFGCGVVDAGGGRMLLRWD